MKDPRSESCLRTVQGRTKEDSGEIHFTVRVQDPGQEVRVQVLQDFSVFRKVRSELSFWNGLYLDKTFSDEHQK